MGALDRETVEAEVAGSPHRPQEHDYVIEGPEGAIAIAQAKSSGGRHPAGGDRNVPRGSTAVASILKDLQRPPDIQELTAEFAKRGWGPKSDNPENAVRAAVNRLRRAGEVVMPDDKTYWLVSRKPELEGQNLQPA